MICLVTGVAGFIGNEVALRLSQEGHEVIGVDNVNDYYDVSLKENRLKRLVDYKNFKFLKIGVEDREAMSSLAADHHFDTIYHMAAQAGVRYSLINPEAYIDANMVGFGNILELARKQKVKHLVYASSSSVYGENEKQPFSEDDPVDHPVSLYAATKKSNEVMAHSYSHLYGIPTTGLRFFTVYGPWGRPDMAPFIFTKAIINGDPIKVFNHGNMHRDFTYIDDIVNGILQSGELPPSKDDRNDRSSPAMSDAPYRVFNIGNSQPVKLMDFISAIESATGRTAEKVYIDMQPGDVPVTYADTKRLESAVGYKPSTDVKTGVKRFVEWYMSYTS